MLLGLKLNFANVIALPLLLGIGVAFNIYFVVGLAARPALFLASASPRAVIFSAATTASGFGTLWLSIHPGTASMGELLMISLGWVLVTTLFLSPALLGPPSAHSRDARSGSVSRISKVRGPFARRTPSRRRGAAVFQPARWRAAPRGERRSSEFV